MLTFLMTGGESGSCALSRSWVYVSGGCVVGVSNASCALGVVVSWARCSLCVGVKAPVVLLEVGVVATDCASWGIIPVRRCWKVAI
jgi:hypothetical protein